jgi:hypothetical protein
MPKLKPLLPLLLAASVIWIIPLAAQAQWASSEIEHDWRVSIGGQSFGLQQQVTYFATPGLGGQRTTTLYLGPYTTTTRLPAAFVAAGVLLPFAAMLALMLAKRAPSNQKS